MMQRIMETYCTTCQTPLSSTILLDIDHTHDIGLCGCFVAPCVGHHACCDDCQFALGHKTSFLKLLGGILNQFIRGFSAA